MYLIHLNGKGRFLPGLPKDCDEYREQFEREAGGVKDKYDWANYVNCWQATPDGLWYDEWLVNCDGAGFLLIGLPDTTAEELKRGEEYIRFKGDVVTFKTLRLKELI